MVLKLRVTIGGDRHHVEIAHVNDSLRPTEIDTDKFVGRVLVRVADFRGSVECARVSESLIDKTWCLTAPTDFFSLLAYGRM